MVKGGADLIGVDVIGSVHMKEEPKPVVVVELGVTAQGLSGDRTHRGLAQVAHQDPARIEHPMQRFAVLACHVTSLS